MINDVLLKTIISEVKSLKRFHTYCEDTWYSCPKHPEGCADDDEGDECQCGAEKNNITINKIVELAQKLK